MLYNAQNQNQMHIYIKSKYLFPFSLIGRNLSQSSKFRYHPICIEISTPIAMPNPSKRSSSRLDQTVPKIVYLDDDDGLISVELVVRAPRKIASVDGAKTIEAVAGANVLRLFLLVIFGSLWDLRLLGFLRSGRSWRRNRCASLGLEVRAPA